MDNIFDRHKFTLPELTAALLEILDEKRSGIANNDKVLYDYSVVGLVTDAVRRLTTKRKTYFNIPKGEIANRRKELGLEKKQVARYCGITVDNYHNFETGSSIMHYESMCYLWDLLYRYDGKPPDASYLKARRQKARHRKRRAESSVSTKDYPKLVK